MDQVQATDPTIQNINAALLAQYRAKQPSLTSSPTTGGTQASFAKTLNQVDAAQATGSASDATTQQESCSEPKISRSARMACAEKATHVDYEDDDFSLGDLVDLLNPLQHIPVVGALYRELTGDEIKPDVQVAGSVLFGVATGSILLSAASGIASAVYENNTGKEPVVQLAQSIWGEDKVGTPDPLTEDKITLADAGQIDPDATPSVSNLSQTKDPVKLAAASAAQAGTNAKTTSGTDSQAASATTAKGVAASKEETTRMAVASANASNKTMPGLLTGSGGLRVGNTVYTGPMMRSAARVNATRSASHTGTANVTPVSTSGQEAAQSTQAQTQTSTTEGTAASTGQTETLGSLMQAQARAHEAGQQLPPQLIEDMMTKALDKYKSAHMTAPEAAATAVE